MEGVNTHEECDDGFGWFRSYTGELDKLYEDDDTVGVKHLIDTVSGTTRWERYYVLYALSMGSTYDNMEMVMYLVGKFNVTTKELFSYNCTAFEKAVEEGYLDMVKYFVETFNLTIEDLRPDQSRGLYLACCGGHVEVVEYMVDTFRLDNEDITSKDECISGHLNKRSVFMVACKEGNTEVVSFFIHRQWLSPGCARDVIKNLEVYLNELIELDNLYPISSIVEVITILKSAYPPPKNATC